MRERIRNRHANNNGTYDIEHHNPTISEPKNMKIKPTSRSLKRRKQRPMIIIGRSCIISVLFILFLIAIVAPNFVLMNQYTTMSSMERRNTRSNIPKEGRRARTTPPPMKNNPPRYKFEPELIADLPLWSGGALPKCNPSNPYRILITGILSSTLSMGLALSLSLQNTNCVSIIGIDSLLPNTPEKRWEYMDRLKILKKHNVPSKLLLPYSGVFPLGVSEEVFRGELDKAQLTHIIHVMKEGDVSAYRETSQSLLSMEQILGYLKGNTKTKLIYISGGEERDRALKKADEVLASTYYSLYGVSSVGVRLPSVFGPWGMDVLHKLTEGLVRNSTLPPPPPSDQGLTLMSVNDAAHSVFTAMQHETQGAVVFHTPKGSETITLSSLHHQMQQVWDSSSSDYSSMSKLQKALYQSIGSRYYQAYPHGPAPYDKNFAANLWKSALPVQYPCVSECSHKSYCQETDLDPLVPILHRVTKKCKYVLYTDNFDEELDDLTNVQEYTLGDSEYCYVIFLYQNAPFLQNATLSLHGISLVKGWITISLPKSSLTPSTSTLIKLSPSKLFSPTVLKAMYFHTKSPPPFYVLEQILDQMETPYIPPRKKWKRASDGTRIKIPIADEPPRHITFMSSHYNVDTEDNMLQVMDQIRALKHPEENSVGSRQYQFYQMTQTLLDDKILRAPTPVEITKSLRAKGLTQPMTFPLFFIRSTWMVHDFQYKDFRCDAYHEQLFWGYDHLEDWSLMYTYAKWFGEGLLGETDGEFGPLNGRDEGGVRLYLRVLKKPIKITS